MATVDLTTLDIQHITRTILAGRLVSSKMLGVPYVIDPKTTLNEKFKFLSDQKPAANEAYHIRAYGIGNGGHVKAQGDSIDTNVNADVLIDISLPAQHGPDHFALFSQIPFVLREENDDLDATDRAKYLARITGLNYNGVTYIGYYLKKLDLSQAAPKIKHYTTKDGVTTSVAFVPDDINLNPVRKALAPEAVNLATGDYLAVESLVPIVLTREEIDEIRKACTIIYGSPLYAVISEIGIVACAERNVPAALGNEAISAQIMTHIVCDFNLNYANKGVDIEVNMGVTEPMIIKG